jgi:alpha-glucosidase (family GH31 glycosyl hydrolase)
VTASVADDGVLRLSRGEDSLLRGSAPTCRGWRGGEPSAAILRIDSDARGFTLDAAADRADTIELRIELASGRHWYGMGELLHQRWPLEEVALQRSRFLTWDCGTSGIGNVLEPIWFTATGIGLWVAPDDPQIDWVSLNQPPDDGRVPPWSPALAVRTPMSERPFALDEVGGDGLLTIRVAGERLRIRLLVGETIRDVQRAFTDLAGRPEAPPSSRAMALPTWTTWARYKERIDQRTCLGFVDEITAAGFPIGTLEIDDKWQAEYGDMAFDPERFPEPRRMIDELHGRNVAATAWVTPFISPRAASAEEAVRGRLVVRDRHDAPYLVTWWQGPGYLLDVSDPRAEAWFIERLGGLQLETGLDGWKFDAGEACYLPDDATTAGSITRNEYSHLYADMVGRRFPDSDARTAWRNQRSTMLLREWDKDSEWGLGNGLQAVLPQALTFGLIGYPFVLADMIGGNAYGGQRADGELIVRWTQATALLPAMQFSLAPWDHGAEISDMARRATELHVAFGPEFDRLAAEAVETGRPIVRPLVLEFPGDRETETIADQFMLGERWLVAPVMQSGARERAIYLPAGRWRDELGTIHDGPGWLRREPVPLDRLPYFERVAAPR